MKLTLHNRLRICWEVMTICGCPNEKILSIFQRGYMAGMKDQKLCDQAVRSQAGELWQQLAAEAWNALPRGEE